MYHLTPVSMAAETTRLLQTVRRDNCRLVSTVIGTCLNKLLMERDVVGAQE